MKTKIIFILILFPFLNFSQNDAIKADTTKYKIDRVKPLKKLNSYFIEVEALKSDRNNWPDYFKPNKKEITIDNDFVLTDVILLSGNTYIKIDINNLNYTGLLNKSFTSGIFLKKGTKISLSCGNNIGSINLEISKFTHVNSKITSIQLLGYFAEPVYSKNEVEQLRADIFERLEEISKDVFKNINEEELAKKMTARIEEQLEELIIKLNDLNPEKIKN